MGDINLLCQHIIQTVDQLQQQLKLVKRRLPTDTTIANLGLNKEVNESLYQCYQHAGKIWKTLHDIVKSAVQAINTSAGILFLAICCFFLFNWGCFKMRKGV